MFTVHSKANDTEYKMWGVDAKLLIYSVAKTTIQLHVSVCLFSKVKPKNCFKLNYFILHASF